MQRTLCAHAALIAVCAVGHRAHAEAFNFDFGFQTGIPVLTYGAASGQAGHWFIPTTDNSPVNFPNTLDINHVATDVNFTSTAPLTWRGNLGLVGDDDLVGLIADGVLIGPSMETLTSERSFVQLRFENLNNGAYEVYSYGWSPLDFDAVLRVTIDGETHTAGGQFPPFFFIEGTTHTRHTVTVTDGTLEIDYAAQSGLAMLTGLQIVPVPAPGTAGTGLVAMMLLSNRRRIDPGSSARRRS